MLDNLKEQRCSYEEELAQRERRLRAESEQRVKADNELRNRIEVMARLENRVDVMTAELEQQYYQVHIANEKAISWKERSEGQLNELMQLKHELVSANVSCFFEIL